MSRGLKSLIVSFTVIGVVLISGDFLLHSSLSLRYLLNTIYRSTGWDVSLKDSKLRLYRGLVIAWGLEVKDPKGEIRFTSEQLFIHVSPLSLIRGKLIVTDLTVDHPEVYLPAPTKSPKPSLDLTEMSQKIRNLFAKFEKSLFLQNAILDHIVVHDLILHQKDKPDLLVEEAKLKIVPNFGREIEVNVGIANASGLGTPLKKIEVGIAIARDHIHLRKIAMDWNKIRLGLEGEWKGDLVKGSLDLHGQMDVPTVLSDPLTFSIDSNLEKQIAIIKKLEAHLGKASLTGNGEVDLKKLLYHVTFSAKDLPLESIFKQLNSVVLSPAKGIAEAEGEAIGQIPSIHIQANAKMHNLTHGPIAARETGGTVTFNWPTLDFDAKVKPGPGEDIQALVKGGVLFKRVPGMEKIQVELKGIDATFEKSNLADLLPSLKMGGLLDGSLHLGEGPQFTVQGSGHALVTAAHWQAMPVDSLKTDIAIHPGGQVTLSHTEINTPYFNTPEWPGTMEITPVPDGVELTGQPSRNISFKSKYQKGSGLFSISSFKIRNETSHLEGAGNFYTGSPSGNLNGWLKGTINLEWLLTMPALFREARGMADVDLHASGTLNNPAFQGHVQFHNDEISFRNLAEGFTGLNGTLAIDGASVKPKLYGQWEDGTFKLDGSLHLDHWKPKELNLALKGKNLSISKHKTYKIYFDTDVTLQGALPSPTLAGRVDIVDGRYFKNFVIRDLVLQQEDTTLEPTDFEKTLQGIQLDLKVKNSGDLKINNNVAINILLLSDLEVRGTYSHPRVNGALSVTDGKFHFLGEDFEISDGRLEYLDPSRNEPYLSLTAQRDMSQNEVSPSSYIVNVSVKGYLSNLEVTLSSIPSLKRGDIVSLIITGVTQAQAFSNGNSGRMLTSNLLGSEISTILERPLSKTTGLDIFRLEASESGNLSRFSFGKNLTDRFSLEFLNDLDPKTAERTVQANYSLTDNILLKGFSIWKNTEGGTLRYEFNVSFRFRLY